MILTTTPTIEGRTITEYKGVVFGEVISGVNFIRDFAASIRNIVGGRSGSYEDELIEARSKAMNEMAARICANDTGALPPNPCAPSARPANADIVRSPMRCNVHN